MERKYQSLCELLGKAVVNVEDYAEIEDELGLEHGEIEIFCVVNNVAPEEAKVHFQGEMRKRRRQKRD